MKNWLLRQSDFTRWSIIGASASVAIGMVASAVFVIAVILVFMLGQRTMFGIVYPPVLDKIVEADFYILGVSTIGFLISVAFLIASLFVGRKTERGRSRRIKLLPSDQARGRRENQPPPDEGEWT